MSAITRIGAIVAMTQERVIGRKGEGMPWHYTEDMKRFARLTTGHTIIMGRHTFDAIGAQPLPRRRNIVVSRTTKFTNVDSFTSIESALAECENEVWIIGGGVVYAAAMPFYHFVDMTYVPDHITGDDLVYFPELDEQEWHASELTRSAEDDRLQRRTFTRR